MKHKSIRLVLIIVILLAAMPLAAAAPVSQAQTEISMIYWGGEGEAAALEAMIGACEAENPDIAVENIWSQGQYEQNLLTMIAGGTAPDLIMIAGGNPLINFADQFLPLEDMGVDTSVYAQEYIANDVMIDGQLRAVPFLAKPKALGINVGAFEAAGVEVPSLTEPLTAEQYQELAIALTSGEGDDRIFGSADLWLGQWAFAFGASFFSEDGTQFTVDSPEMIAAAEYIDDAVNKYNYAPNVIQREGADTFGWFTLGKIAMWPDFGPWHLPRMYEAEDLEWQLLPVPTPTQEVEIDGLGIHKDTADPEAALRFALCMGQSSAAQTVVATTPGVAIPVTTEGQEAFLAYDPDHNLGAFLVNLESALPRVQSCMDNAIWGEYFGAYQDETTTYNGDTPPAEFMKDIAEYINSEFACD